jgi:SagB-type dehydrogenase family enzyme
MVSVELVRPARLQSAGGTRLLRSVLAASALSILPLQAGCAQQAGGPGEMIQLPAVPLDGTVSVERAIHGRRSVRTFRDEPISLAAIARLLWAAQGVTAPSADPPEGFTWEWMGGRRTAPSAGALYPLELYAVVGDVESLEPGLYHYVPTAHGLELVQAGDLRVTLWEAALRQTAIRDAPATLVFGAVVARTEAKYGERAERYVHMEVGAAAENVYLQCEALGLGTVFMGAFGDEAVRVGMGLPRDQRVFGIMPLGEKAGG